MTLVARGHMLKGVQKTEYGIQRVGITSVTEQWQVGKNNCSTCKWPLVVQYALPRL